MMVAMNGLHGFPLTAGELGQRLAAGGPDALLRLVNGLLAAWAAQNGPGIPLRLNEIQKYRGHYPSYLDHLIPLSQNHLRLILKEYVAYYNHHRPHSSLGPGIPDPAGGLPVEPQADRHRLPEGAKVVSAPVLGGLHHTYRLVKAA